VAYKPTSEEIEVHPQTFRDFPRLWRRPQQVSGRSREGSRGPNGLRRSPLADAGRRTSKLLVSRGIGDRLGRATDFQASTLLTDGGDQMLSYSTFSTDPKTWS
jgi:hypothetical protein